jgi:multidrug efflux pump
VLLGLLITGQPFGIVMSGVGVIALAGIVVNNNIVLIDTYNRQRKSGRDAFESVLRTGALRLRPVLLTTVTTILGLLPMVLGINIDFIGREISIGGPSTQWWTQLATAVAGGLAFATLLTLIMTPCLLLLGERTKQPQISRGEKLTPKVLINP